MTEKQISEEDRAALRTAIHSINHRTCTTDALIDKIIQALHSRGRRRREDVLVDEVIIRDAWQAGHEYRGPAPNANRFSYVQRTLAALKDTP